MSDNFKMQTASFGSWFKSKLLGGVHHPGHISYKEDGTPVDHATEASLAAVLALLRGAGFNVALPADAATASNQTTANGALTHLDANLGAKADAAWNGTDAAASGISIFKYIGAKIEAARALLAGTLTVALPSGAATAANQATANGSLASILSTLQSQRAESVWTDDSGAFYIRIDAGGTITWTTVTGGGSGGPGTGARPAAGTSALVDRVSYQATAGGTGYSIGDALDHFVTLDPSTGAILGHFWINATTEAVIAAPSAGNISPLSPLPAGAATAANQAAANAALASILTGITNLLTQTVLAAGTAIIGKVGIDAAVNAVTQPDVRGTGTIASATPNAAYTIALNNGAGVCAFSVTGLTASGATLAIEASDDTGTTWSGVNGIAPATGILFSTLTTDQQFRVNTGGRTNVRLRVSATGAGNIAVASNASRVSSASALSSPLPGGSNIIGKVGVDPTTPLGTRPKVVMTTFTPAASGTYANGVNIGGKLMFATGLPAGTSVLLDFLQLAFVATSLTGVAPSLNAFACDSNPTATVTDGMTPTFNAGDAAFLAKGSAIAAVSGSNAVGLWFNSGSLQASEAIVDGSGNLYVVLMVGGVPPTYGASPGTATVRLGLRY